MDFHRINTRDYRVTTTPLALVVNGERVPWYVDPNDCTIVISTTVDAVGRAIRATAAAWEYELAQPAADASICLLPASAMALIPLAFFSEEQPPLPKLVHHLNGYPVPLIYPSSLDPQHCRAMPRSWYHRDAAKQPNA